MEDGVNRAGGTLAAAYGIHMPQNAFKKFWENNDRIVARSRKRCRKIAKNTRNRITGIRIRSLLQQIILLMHERFLPNYRKGLSVRSGLSEDTDMETLVRVVDKTFASNDQCTGCGLCEKKLPSKKHCDGEESPEMAGTLRKLFGIL